jgi:hypothetical protein
MKERQWWKYEGTNYFLEVIQSCFVTLDANSVHVYKELII